MPLPPDPLCTDPPGLPELPRPVGFAELALARASKRSVAWEESTRTVDTEAAYRTRAKRLSRRVARLLGVAVVSPLELATYVLSQRAEWAKSTWRQNKAALVFVWGELGDPDSLAASALLRSHTQSVSHKKGNATSALRRKQAKGADFDRVLGAVRASRSQHASFLADWLRFGVMFGLRPHEWTHAEVVWCRASELGILDGIDVEVQGGSHPSTDPDPMRAYLRVRNGKATNGRAHGDFRHLTLGSLAQSEIQGLRAFLERMAAVANSGGYERVYNTCRQLLLRVNRKNLGADGLPLRDVRAAPSLIQMYSPRHQFSANSKLAYSQAEVAALMGHRSDATAQFHYGRRVAGEVGGSMVSPVATEVARVRVTGDPTDGLSKARRGIK